MSPRARAATAPGARVSAVRSLAVALCLVVLAGCTSARASSDPTWVPQQTLPPAAMPTPVQPDGGAGGTGGTTAPPSSSPGQTPGGTPSTGTQDPAVVATKLAAPTGLAVLPDGTALVGERTTGRIVIVQPVAGKPVRVVRTLTGLDTAGGGGLLDLALSATYSQDGLVLALITTRTDTRVVHFTLTGPVTAIVTGIPRGAVDNTGRLFVEADGDVLIGTGDAGTAARAVDPRSLGGKVLRVDDIGKAAADNPTKGSRVYTSGHKVVDGFCQDPLTGAIYQTEAGATDELNRITPGASYGWPGGGGTASQALPTGIRGIGGCAITGGKIYIAARGGQAIYQAALSSGGAIGTFTTLIPKKYGRLLTLVAAADGTLWITTSNRDGSGRPVAADERVLHIMPAGGGGQSQA